MATQALDTVRIDGYRWLRGLELRDLGRINLLVGRNNSGKTSVLEALSILCKPFDPMEWLDVIRRRDFGRLDESRTQSLRWCLRQTGVDPEARLSTADRCEMSCWGQFVIDTLVVTMREIFGEPPPRRNVPLRRDRPQEPEIRRGVEITHAIRAPSSQLLQSHGTGEWIEERAAVWDGEFYSSFRREPAPGLQVETLSPYSYQINRFQVRNLSRSIRRGHQAEIVRLLRVFDSDILDVGVLSLAGDRPAIYITHRRLGVAPLSVFGDAVRRVTLLASSITHLKDGLLLIDEVEAGVHVSTLPAVFAWLHAAATQYGVQVIATTHSLEALDAMIGKEISLDGDQVVAFHLDQDESGTSVKRFDADLLSRLRFERGLDVR